LSLTENRSGLFSRQNIDHLNDGVRREQVRSVGHQRSRDGAVEVRLPYVMKNNSRVGFGGSRNILGTDLDAIYQTQRTGIKQFKFDVPDGDYELVLHFAELLSKNTGNDIAFNLGGRGAPEEYKARSFDVLVNGQEVLSGLSNSEALKTDQPLATKCLVSVTSQEGVTVAFKARQREAILNGIQIRKIR
jgi:beta-galactosidase